MSPPGDQARVSVLVEVPPDVAFAMFTERSTGGGGAACTTEVEVTFDPSPSGTLVTVTQRGWAAIRPDHPARHGLEVPAFIRMMGMWWGDLMTSMREHAAHRRHQLGLP